MIFYTLAKENTLLTIYLVHFVFNLTNKTTNEEFSSTELNATKATDTAGAEEDVLYQKDVSFSAELEIAPSNRISKPTVSLKHIDEAKRLTTTLPIVHKTPNYTYTGEKFKRVDGLKSLIEDGVSKVDLNIIADESKDAYAEAEKVTTLGPSLEQKVSTYINI